MNLINKADLTDSRLGATVSKSLKDYTSTGDTVAIFGNESSGLSTSNDLSDIETSKYPYARAMLKASICPLLPRLLCITYQICRVNKAVPDSSSPYAR
jgi:hypothetical protein